MGNGDSIRKLFVFNVVRPYAAGESRAAGTSNVPNQVAQAAFERAGDFGQGLNGRLFLPPFDVADVIAREAGLFGQGFLAQAGFLALGANGFSQNAPYFAERRFQCLKWKQNQNPRLPTNGWYFFHFAA